MASSKAFTYIIKMFLYLFGKVACFGWVIQYFVVEDGEVKGKAKSNWVCSFKVRVSNVTGSLIGSKGTISGFLVLITTSVLRDVTVIITLHLMEEDFGFWA
jgi:fucose permease